MNTLMQERACKARNALKLVTLDDDTLLALLPDTHSFVIVILIQTHSFRNEDFPYFCGTSRQEAHDRLGQSKDHLFHWQKLIRLDKGELEAIIPFSTIFIKRVDRLPLKVLQCRDRKSVV